MSSTTFEVHDPAILAEARAVLEACRSAKEMQDAVIAAVKRNEDWRSQRCINLLAPEAPTSPAVRASPAPAINTPLPRANCSIRSGGIVVMEESYRAHPLEDTVIVVRIERKGK